MDNNQNEVKPESTLTSVTPDCLKISKLRYGHAGVTVLEDIHYKNPSNGARVVWKAGSRFVFDYARPDNLSYTAYSADKMKEGQEVIGTLAECLCETVSGRGLRASSLKELGERVVSTILFHATNRDGTEGTVLNRYVAERRFRGFGIEYISFGE